MAGSIYSPLNLPILDIMRNDILDEDIAFEPPTWCPSGRESGKESHCTLFYGMTYEDGSDATPDIYPALRDAFWGVELRFKGLAFVPGDVAVFNNDNWDCLIVKASPLYVATEELAEFHRTIKDTFGFVGSEFAYSPHITLGYVKKGLGKKYVDKFKYYAGLKWIPLQEIKVNFKGHDQDLSYTLKY